MKFFMGIAVDVIILLIIGLCVLIGYKRGLARCLLNVVTTIVAIIVAITLYKPLVNFVVENTTIDENIQLSLERVINNSIEGKKQENNTTESNTNIEETQENNEKAPTTDESANEQPVAEEVRVEINENSGIPKPIAEYLNENIKEKVDAKKDEAVSATARSAALLIVDIAAVIIIYIVVKILLKILTILTDIVTKIPVIKQFNELCGVAYGLLEGVFLILIAMTIISVITPLTGGYEIANFIMQSHIGKIFYNNNIILNIIF